MNFLAIVIVGIGTYIFRAAFIVGFAEREMSPGLIRALEFVGPAVLSALVVALLVGDSGGVELGVPEVAALALAGVVGWRTRNLIYTVVAGMGAFWLLQIWF
jgi:branched-subunit amino acid transport protein